MRNSLRGFHTTLMTQHNTRTGKGRFEMTTFPIENIHFPSIGQRTTDVIITADEAVNPPPLKKPYV